MLLCAAVLATALAGAAASAANSPKSAWFTFGFEGVIAVAGLFGVLTATGRLRGSPALCYACVAGCVALGSLLGYLGVKGVLMGVGLKPMLAARAALALGLAAYASHLVFRASGKAAYKSFLLGMLLGLGALAPMAAAWSARRSLADMNEVVLAVVVVFGGLAVIGVGAAGVHLVIRAYTLGIDKGRGELS